MWPRWHTKIIMSFWWRLSCTAADNIGRHRNGCIVTCSLFDANYVPHNKISVLEVHNMFTLILNLAILNNKIVNRRVSHFRDGTCRHNFRKISARTFSWAPEWLWSDLLTFLSVWWYFWWTCCAIGDSVSYLPNFNSSCIFCNNFLLSGWPSSLQYIYFVNLKPGY